MAGLEEKLRFEAKNQSVEDVLFSAVTKYRVPRYQRPYAWDDDQLSEFWNDLFENSDPYFIGSLIFNYESFQKTRYVDIIDGQQRLLTITILCAVLRDIVRELDADTSNRYHKQDIALEDREGRESFRILPGDSTQPYFTKYIQERGNDIRDSKPKTREEIRIKKSYLYLLEKVHDDLKNHDSKERKLARLSELRRRLSNLIVIRIKIESEEEAYEIFETTNARGIDLSVADLLKNLVFQQIKAKDNKDFAKEVWQEITSNVESTNTELKKFIRYYWISKYSFVTEKGLFKAIKREITDWMAFLEDLWDSSGWYNKILEGTEEDFDGINLSERIFRSICGIRLMGVSQCYVLFLAILRSLSKLRTSPARVFQFVEMFTFQYSVVSKLPGNRLERIYSRYALRIEEAVNHTSEQKIGGRIQSIFSELERDLLDERPPPDLFKENFLELECRNSTKSRMLTKYILERIDSLYRETGEERIDFANVNMEHILPIQPDTNWKLKKKEIKPYVNKLGNLTLIDKRINSRVQNAVVREKIDEYRSSRLPITKKLVKRLDNMGHKWDEEQIIRRQEEFADLAYSRIWNL